MGRGGGGGGRGGGRGGIEINHHSATFHSDGQQFRSIEAYVCNVLGMSNGVFFVWTERHTAGVFSLSSSSPFFFFFFFFF